MDLALNFFKNFSNVFVEKHQIGFLTERSQVERGIMVYCLVAGWWCTNYVSCLVRILHDIPQRFGCFSAARVDGIVVPVLSFSNLNFFQSNFDK